MAILNTATIPEIQDAIVMLRKLSADEKVRVEAFYREKHLHDEAAALGTARREGFAEGEDSGEAKGRAETTAKIIAQMRKSGFTEEQIKLALGE